jgi:hypothetical protein
MSRFKDRRFKDSSAVHLPLVCGAAPMAGATTRGRWPAGGAASRASTAPTADAAAQHPQPAVDAAPTDPLHAGLHLPEDGSYPKTSTTPTAPRQITSLCSFPLLHRCGILLCTWDIDTCHLLCCNSCCLFAVICSRMFVSCLFVCCYDLEKTLCCYLVSRWQQEIHDVYVFSLGKVCLLLFSNCPEYWIEVGLIVLSTG